MKNIYKSIFVIAASALALSSCNTLLDIEQHGVDPKETFYTTDEAILSANAESYIAFRQAPSGGTSIGLPGFYGALDWAWTNDKEGGSDNAWSGGGGRGENIDGDGVSEWSLDSDNPAIRTYYVLMYCIIYRSNIVLDQTTDGQSAVIDMCRAEARVFRDFAYFELVTLFGNPPLIDHCLTPDEYKVSNSSPAEIWAFLEEDLKAAINSNALSEKSSVNDNTTWRITKQYAQALLGKVYVWQKKWSEAVSTFDAVIKSGKYKLFEGEYGDMSHAGNDYNCESMFEINRIPDSSVSQGFSYKGIYFNMRADKFTFSGSGTLGIKASDYFETSGWGICVPTQDLYDAFVKHEGKDGYRLNQTLRTYSQLNKEYGIRMVNGAVALGDSLWYWKSRYIKSDREGITSNRSYQSRYMRYAEVLLLAAEANLENGNNPQATEYLNQIRRRARLSDLSSITLDDIKIEKRLELCGEGTRLQDIQRWGDGPKVLGATGTKLAKGIPYITIAYDENHPDDPSYDVMKVEYMHPYSSTDAYGYKTGKHEYWPIPAMEIGINPNIVQNPGY